MSSCGSDNGSIPRLFGSDVRSRYLLALLCDGPTHDAELAHRIGVDRSHIVQLTTHFTQLGIVCKATDKRLAAIAFNDEFIASTELLRVLRAVASWSGRTALSRAKVIASGTVEAKVANLFGSRDRTIVLALIESLGRINITDLAGLAKLNHGSVRAVISHFANQGVLRCTRIPPNVYVELDAGFMAAQELRLLIRKVAGALGTKQLVKVQHSKARARVARSLFNSSSDPVQFVPLGTRTQAEILLALSRVGSIRVSDLAKLIGTSQDSVRGVSDSLVRAGFVVRQTKKGGRNTERWISLNALHPLYESLQPLLCAITSDSRIRASGARALANASPRPLPPVSVTELQLIGSDRSLDVLLALYRNPDRHVAEVALDIELPINRVRRHIDALSHIGVLRTRIIRGQSRTSLNPHSRYARLIRDFLTSLDRQTMPNR